MGPTCEISLTSGLTVASLALIDDYLQTVVEEIVTTRKGRNWGIQVNGRPVTISADSGSEISLTAACNLPEDYDVLRRIAADLAGKLGGVRSEPSK